MSSASKHVGSLNGRPATLRIPLLAEVILFSLQFSGFLVQQTCFMLQAHKSQEHHNTGLFVRIPRQLFG